MLHDFIIINKSGGVVYSRNLSQQPTNLSGNDYLRLGSTFHSLHAIATQVAPVESFGIEVVECDNFHLHSFSSRTGIKFVITSGPGVSEIETLLQNLYELYADYVLKSPFYEIDMPIRLEIFNQAVDKLMNRIPVSQKRR